MRMRVFRLTRNEQRVVILTLMLVIAGALVRYRKNVRREPLPSRPADAAGIVTPVPSPEEEHPSDQD
jgi:hypothetical protein